MSISVSGENQEQSSKLRVLLAGHLPPPIGGVGTYYQSLLNSTLSERVNLTFVQTSTHNRPASESGRPTLQNLIEAVKDCARFTHALIQHRPQLCDISTAFGLSFLKHSLCVVIARLCKCRILLHPHCSLSSLYFERSKLWCWYFRQILQQTDGVIALSKEWETLSQIVPGCRVFYLPNAIDTKPYKEIGRERIAKNNVKSTFHVLYLGNLGKSKGSFDVLESANCLSTSDFEFVFNLVGNDVSRGEKDQLRRQVEKMNLAGTVAIHPAASGPDKLSYFRDADIFIYPSYGEGMPMAVIEAMASGLPIVATNVGGLPDLVKEGVNGNLIEPGCSEAFSDAILRLARNPQMISAMQKNSMRIAVEEYDIEQHILKLVDVYQTVWSEISLLLKRRSRFRPEKGKENL